MKGAPPEQQQLNQEENDQIYSRGESTMTHAESQWTVEITDGFIAVTHRATQHLFSFSRMNQTPYIDTESFLDRFEDLDSVPDELIDEAIEIARDAVASEAE
jgi:hypothetical protein